MPVILEPLDTASDRDRAELDRLAGEQTACPAYCSAWASWCAGEGRVRLKVARFNERIVGAALLEGDCLRGLAVRRLTRGRGVGRRLLDLLGEERSWRLDPALNVETAAFIRRRWGRPGG